MDVTYGDQLLTLSTCNNAFDTARLVIVARRVRDGEDPNERIAGSIPNPNIKWPNVYYLRHEKTYDPNAPFAPYGRGLMEMRNHKMKKWQSSAVAAALVFPCLQSDAASRSTRMPA